MSRVLTVTLPPVCEREVLRYAGCRTADDAVCGLMNECMAELLPALSYTACYEEIDPAPYTAQSASLARYLDRCERVYLLAATVGIGADRLIQKYGRLSPSKAVMMQAIATERVEAVCDAFAAHLQAETGLYCRGRFSAGYGDAPLYWQAEIVERLEATKRIGVAVNDSLLLSPAKSVTAFAGFDKQKTVCADKCRACDKQDCAFRGAL
ncbi:MAG: Vitamin B12 dependent methionine synthase activation subunit [Clostridia bacterium]|nr:Vitamin B12 dependent methionine synthase activation subunit [Clostridia bacterium]